MNTVLDDSRKLCLPDSSNIRIPRLMNLIFEVQDLKVASPATVSRCGMVYVEPHHVGLRPIIESWALKYKEKLTKELAEELQKRKDTYTEYINHTDTIKNFLLEHIESYKDIIREKFKEKIPSVDINLVQSCLKFISCFFQPSVIKPEAKPETFIKYYLAFSIIWSLGANISDEYRKAFSTIFKKELESSLGVKFAKDAGGKSFTSVYDYAVKPDSPTAEFELFFDDSMQRELNEIPEDTPYFEILVKTGDTEKYSRLMKILSDEGYCSLFMGETGVGKSVIVMNYLKNINKEKFICKSSNFSAKTISKNVFDVLKTTIFKNGNFVPPAGKRFIYFVDDINLPQLDTFGNCPVLEFCRQLIDNKMLYDEKKMPRTIKDTLFISACAPPSGGRNPVTPRLFRHFNMIWMTDLSKDSMELIFSNILRNYLRKTKLEKETDPIINVALTIYMKIREKLLPTPSKSHYTFNLRDMSKVIQGMKKPNTKDLTEKKILAFLWAHETCRQFRDRLVTKEDIDWFDTEINTLYEGPLQMEKKSLVPLNSLVFTFVKDNAYKYEPSYEILLKKVNDDLQKFNQNPKNTKMDLVFFTDAINHYTRISRILSLERGNALLIGLGGSGRQSLTKLVVSGLNQDFFALQIKKEYGPVEFGKDLIEILKTSGTKGSASSFLFSDTQILKESFMEDINNILNNGEVPNLLKEDDLAFIQNVLKDKARDKGFPDTKDGIYQYFVSCVKDNLHIILSFSPVGSGLRNRCIQFPSIINCCTIDWFNVWPDEALKSVGENYLKKIGETVRGQQLNTVKPLPKYLITQLSKVFVEIQKKAIDLSTKFASELRRNYYITPTSYLGFLKLFNTIYNEKIKIIPEKIKNYKLGIGKLKEANEIVNKLKEELIILDPQLKQKQKEVSDMIGILEEKKKVVNAEKDKIEDEAKVIEKQKGEIEVMKEQCDRELAKAKPALEAAQVALNSLEEKDLTQLRSYPKPVQAIVQLAKNICYVFECKNLEYNDFKGLLSDVKQFKAKCLDTDTMIKKLNNTQKLLTLGKYYGEIANLDFSKISGAAMGLKTYVGALLGYVKTYKEVKPKMDLQEKATKELKEVLDKLQAKRDALKEKQDELADLTKQYNSNVREAKRLEENIHTIQVKMVRAGKLVDGLKDEGVRWADNIVILGKDEKNLLSNVIISSAIVGYFGPFTVEYRKEFLDSLTEVIIRNGFHYSCKEEEKKEEEENKPIEDPEINITDLD
ncbi:MAG: AAA family ATPase [archaeon]|nr:AAA family ATPase [archaeon]